MAVVLGGLVIGALFGAIVQRTNYCMMGAVADFAISGDLRRLRAWMLAIAVAMVASQALHLGGWIDLSTAFYRAPLLPWAGIVVGGLLFGFGMVIACGCSSRSLVNFASGDLRALIALVFMGVFAYMTINGLTAYPRVWLNAASALDLDAHGLADQGLGRLLAAATGTSGAGGDVLVTLVLASSLAAFALRDPGFRAQRRYLLASLSLGVLIAAGWWITGVLGADDFEPEPLLSLRFVAPVGDSLQYLMTFTGSRMDFGVATVLGVIAGAGTAAVASRTFAFRAFEDLHDLRRYIVGGALMGVGGVMSLGCTVGQGLTGVSTLSLGSFIALAAIIAGGMLGVRYLEQGSLVSALRAALGRV